MAASDVWADKLAVQETINRYSDAANRADWDALQRCYAPGSVWEVVEPLQLRFEEPAGIRNGVVSYIGEVDTFIQTVHNTVVTLGETGTAHARSTLQEIVRTEGKFDLVLWGITYDELVRWEADWKFSRRSFHGVYVDRSPMGGVSSLSRRDLD